MIAMIRLRPAKDEDMGRVIELERLCFKHPYPPPVLYMLRGLYPELFIVAEVGGRVVGYVSAVVRRGGVGHIVSLCVDPGYRRRGIGRALMEEVERRLRRLFEVKMLRLEVRVSNKPAINLYQSLGYQVVERVPGYYPDGEDAYVMVKPTRGKGNTLESAEL